MSFNERLSSLAKILLDEIGRFACVAPVERLDIQPNRSIFPKPRTGILAAVVHGKAKLGNLAAVGVALRLFGWNGYLAQAAGVLPYAAVTYLGAKHLVFRAAAAVPVKPGACDTANTDPGIAEHRKRDARA